MCKDTHAYDNYFDFTKGTYLAATSHTNHILGGLESIQIR